MEGDSENSLQKENIFNQVIGYWFRDTAAMSPLRVNNLATEIWFFDWNL